LVVAYFSIGARARGHDVFAEVWGTGLSVNGLGFGIGADGRPVMQGTPTGNGGRFDLVEAADDGSFGEAYEIEHVSEAAFGWGEINYKVGAYAGARKSKSKNFTSPEVIVHGDKFGALAQVVGFDPNNPLNVLVAWQDAPGLIIWSSVPRVLVPRPETILRWDPKLKRAVDAPVPTSGWKPATTSTIEISTEQGVVIVTVVAGSVVVAGVAGLRNFAPPQNHTPNSLAIGRT
jgi:hypothetical protein